MSTQFHGTAEDIQHKLIAGKGITIGSDNTISSFRTTTNPDYAMADGLYFIPANTYSSMPNGSAGCAILIVATGDVGGAPGVRQFLLLENATYRRYRYSTGTWTPWKSGDLGTLLDGNAVNGLGLISDADKVAIGSAIVEDTDNAVSYLAKIKLIGGKPVIEYDEI